MSIEKIIEECTVGDPILELKDEIQKSYEGRLDEAYGIILMSKRKLLFITEKGLFRKRYNLVLALPYEKIRGLQSDGKYNLIIEAENLKHTFISTGLRISIIEKALIELMVQKPS